MEIETAPRYGNKLMHHRLGPQPLAAQVRANKVCFHWRAGRCYRYPCPFLHSDGAPPKRAHHQPPGGGGSLVWRNPNPSAPSKCGKGQGGAARAPIKVVDKVPDKVLDKVPDEVADIKVFDKVPDEVPDIKVLVKVPDEVHDFKVIDKVPDEVPDIKVIDKVPDEVPDIKVIDKVPDKVCNYFITAGNCPYGENCRFLHSWFVSDSFSLLTTLQGHQKCITGIALPEGSDKLYSGSKDESVHVWDCHTGQCARDINLGGEVGCLISKGPWVFVGTPNAVKAWNTQTATELSLDGPSGQVYALEVANEMLFAGTHDGRILVWKFSAGTNSFEPVALLTGHKLAVVSLIMGAMRLYSGSMDNTIRVWDVTTLQCLQTLTDHTSVVMSLLCWDQYLLSCSLDQTIKVWVATESGNLEVTYTHTEEHGVLALCGVHDAQAKPVLLCSCNDNSVRLYDLPSFSERGKIFSKEEVRALQIGPGGLFFSGDGTGKLKVWKWLTNETPAACSS